MGGQVPPQLRTALWRQLARCGCLPVSSCESLPLTWVPRGLGSAGQSLRFGVCPAPAGLALRFLADPLVPQAWWQHGSRKEGDTEQGKVCSQVSILVCWEEEARGGLVPTAEGWPASANLQDAVVLAPTLHRPPPLLLARPAVLPAGAFCSARPAASHVSLAASRVFRYSQHMAAGLPQLDRVAVEASV